MTVQSMPDCLFDVSVEELMSKAVLLVPSRTPCFEALCLMADRNVGSVVVVKQERYNRQVVKSDVLGLAPVFFALRCHLDDQRTGRREPSLIDEAMVKRFVFVHKDHLLSTIVPAIVDNQTWRMIVVDSDDYMVGLISVSDIFYHLKRHFD